MLDRLPDLIMPSEVKEPGLSVQSPIQVTPKEVTQHLAPMAVAHTTCSSSVLRRLGIKKEKDTDAVSYMPFGAATQLEPCPT